MVYAIWTGISWYDLPECYGRWQMVYTRFAATPWTTCSPGPCSRSKPGSGAAGDIDWLIPIDSSIVNAHEHAAATGLKGGPKGRTNRTVTPPVDPEAD